MQLLTASPAPDTIGAVLGAVRVRSSVYCRSLMRAPWGFAVEAHGNPAFHLVTSGRCWLEVEGAPGQRELRAGDLVVLPTGRRHAVRDSPGTPATDLDEILAATPPDARGRLQHGGDGPRTVLLCGGFVLEGDSADPILQSLPRQIVVAGAGGRPVPWLAATVRMIAAEARSTTPGSEQVLRTLADAMLTQALRAALVELAASDGDSLAVLRDPEVAAAVALIHGRPERAWTVAQLAAEVALSRSTFATRFRQVIGEPPVRYATRTRLAHAASLLRTSDAPLAQIARRAGYRTEFSFGKAFKRMFAIPPGAYRELPAAPALGPGPRAAVEEPSRGLR